jgi:hypothetical protein
MMAKTKIVTTETKEIDPDADEQETPADNPNPDQSELMDYLEGISGTANIVKIYKIIEGVRNYCGKTEPGTLNEDAILKKWGGGQYFLSAFSNGRYVQGGTRTINLFEPIEDALKQRDNNAQHEHNSGEISALRDSLNRQQEMILRMIEANSQKDHVSMPEIFGMMRDMQAMAPKPPDLTSLLTPVMDLFGKTMEMAKDAASGGGDDKWSWIKTAIEKLPAVIAPMLARAQGVPANNGGSEVQTISPEQALVMQGLEWLKKKARSGKSWETISEMLADNMDDELFGPVAVGILNSPFESLVQFDPEIGKEPLRTWFQSLYNDLREIMKGQHGIDTDSKPDAGPGGGAPDASGNETSGH